MSKGDPIEPRPDVVSLADEGGVKQVLIDADPYASQPMAKESGRFPRGAKMTESEFKKEMNHGKDC
jgi:hypothetical protein